MINSIIEAISVALNDAFGDGYEIHMEELEQGLEEPCFFISCLNPSESQFLGKRYLRTNQFCIQYFPAVSEKQRECNDVAERLYECLEYIAPDGDTSPIRGTKMNHEVVDGVLNFFVNYDLFVYKKDSVSVPAMEGVSSGIYMKG
ncbi:MAG: hypothetical protein K2I96_04210 [Lachnospiraceae bacterium]|nr:hypothetical protein [Lachnospiraceae bacterium]